MSQSQKASPRHPDQAQGGRGLPRATQRGRGKGAALDVRRAPTPPETQDTRGDCAHGSPPGA